MGAKGKSKAPALVSAKPPLPTTSSKSVTRKGSADTITYGAPASQPPTAPRGATLEVGIPCIITSKRARFRALARYIGEIEGEAGPWVGVEVPMGDAWPGEKLDRDARTWHDGTWGGVRYFDLLGESEWGDSMESSTGALRRRRGDYSTLGRETLKREGEQLAFERTKRLRSVSPAVSDVTNITESRGLFVRPQQVLYVVDAVGGDL